MPGSVDYLLWFLGAWAEASALVCAYRGKALFKYFTVNLYLAASLLVTVGRYFVFLQFGYGSAQYSYYYYYTDTLLTICLFFALMGLFVHVFEEMGVSRYVRAAALMLLGGTCVVSFQIVKTASENGSLLGPFIILLSRNLNFVGLVLTYLLWAALMKLKNTRRRVVQLVAALGVYVSAFAANYALHSLAPGHTHIWSTLPPVMAVIMPIALGYSYAFVPDEARLATASIATSTAK